MGIEAAQALVGVLAAYAALGLAFALAFVTRGVASIDAEAQGLPWRVRLILLPGAAALWPLMLWKWLKRQPPPVS